MAEMVPNFPLAMPTDEDLIMALGRLAIAHTQLELVLRYTIKTLSGVGHLVAMNGTAKDRMPDLRARIQRLFKDKKATETEKLTLDALLHTARQLSEQRNDYLHAVYSSTPAGRALMQDHRSCVGSGADRKASRRRDSCAPDFVCNAE